MIQLSLPSSPQGADLRQHKRINRELQVRYRSIRAEEWKTSKSGNVSVGGLFILGVEAPRVGSEIVVELLVDGQVIMKGTGTVRQHRQGDPSGFGVQFGAMDDAAHTRILGLVHQYVTGDMQKVERPKEPPARSKGGGAMWAMGAGLIGVAGVVAWWVMHHH